MRDTRLKRLGLVGTAAFIFFFAKGLMWLALMAVAAMNVV